MVSGRVLWLNPHYKLPEVGGTSSSSGGAYKNNTTGACKNTTGACNNASSSVGKNTSSLMVGNNTSSSSLSIADESLHLPETLIRVRLSSNHVVFLFSRNAAICEAIKLKVRVGDILLFKHRPLNKLHAKYGSNLEYYGKNPKCTEELSMPLLPPIMNRATPNDIIKSEIVSHVFIQISGMRTDPKSKSINILHFQGWQQLFQLNREYGINVLKKIFHYERSPIPFLNPENSVSPNLLLLLNEYGHGGLLNADYKGLVRRFYPVGGSKNGSLGKDSMPDGQQLSTSLEKDASEAGSGGSYHQADTPASPVPASASNSPAPPASGNSTAEGSSNTNVNSNSSIKSDLKITIGELLPTAIPSTGSGSLLQYWNLIGRLLNVVVVGSNWIEVRKPNKKMGKSNTFSALNCEKKSNQIRLVQAYQIIDSSFKYLELSEILGVHDGCSAVQESAGGGILHIQDKECYFFMEVVDNSQGSSNEMDNSSNVVGVSDNSSSDHLSRISQGIPQKQCSNFSTKNNTQGSLSKSVSVGQTLTIKIEGIEVCTKSVTRFQYDDMLKCPESTEVDYTSTILLTVSLNSPEHRLLSIIEKSKTPMELEEKLMSTADTRKSRKNTSSELKLKCPLSDNITSKPRKRDSFGALEENSSDHHDFGKRGRRRFISMIPENRIYTSQSDSGKNSSVSSDTAYFQSLSSIHQWGTNFIYEREQLWKMFWKKLNRKPLIARGSFGNYQLMKVENIVGWEEESATKGEEKKQKSIEKPDETIKNSEEVDKFKKCLSFSDNGHDDEDINGRKHFSQQDLVSEPRYKAVYLRDCVNSDPIPIQLWNPGSSTELPYGIMEIPGEKVDEIFGEQKTLASREIFVRDSSAEHSSRNDSGESDSKNDTKESAENDSGENEAKASVKKEAKENVKKEAKENTRRSQNLNRLSQDIMMSQQEKISFNWSQGMGSCYDMSQTPSQILSHSQIVNPSQMLSQGDYTSDEVRVPTTSQDFEVRIPTTSQDFEVRISEIQISSDKKRNNQGDGTRNNFTQEAKRRRLSIELDPIIECSEVFDKSDPILEEFNSESDIPESSIRMLKLASSRPIRGSPIIGTNKSPNITMSKVSLATTRAADPPAEGATFSSPLELADVANGMPVVMTASSLIAEKNLDGLIGLGGPQGRPDLQDVIQGVHGLKALQNISGLQNIPRLQVLPSNLAINEKHVAEVDVFDEGLPSEIRNSIEQTLKPLQTPPENPPSQMLSQSMQNPAGPLQEASAIFLGSEVDVIPEGGSDIGASDVGSAVSSLLPSPDNSEYSRVVSSIGVASNFDSLEKKVSSDRDSQEKNPLQAVPEEENISTGVVDDTRVQEIGFEQNVAGTKRGQFNGDNDAKKEAATLQRAPISLKEGDLYLLGWTDQRGMVSVLKYPGWAYHGRHERWKMRQMKRWMKEREKRKLKEKMQVAQEKARQEAEKQEKQKREEREALEKARREKQDMEREKSRSTLEKLTKLFNLDQQKINPYADLPLDEIPIKIQPSGIVAPCEVGNYLMVPRLKVCVQKPSRDDEENQEPNQAQKFSKFNTFSNGNQIQMPIHLNQANHRVIHSDGNRMHSGMNHMNTTTTNQMNLNSNVLPNQAVSPNGNKMNPSGAPPNRNGNQVDQPEKPPTTMIEHITTTMVCDIWPVHARNAINWTIEETDVSKDPDYNTKEAKAARTKEEEKRIQEEERLAEEQKAEQEKKAEEEKKAKEEKDRQNSRQNTNKGKACKKGGMVGYSTKGAGKRDCQKRVCRTPCEEIERRILSQENKDKFLCSVEEPQFDPLRNLSSSESNASSDLSDSDDEEVCGTKQENVCEKAGEIAKKDPEAERNTDGSKDFQKVERNTEEIRSEIPPDKRIILRITRVLFGFSLHQTRSTKKPVVVDIDCTKEQGMEELRDSLGIRDTVFDITDICQQILEEAGDPNLPTNIPKKRLKSPLHIIQSILQNYLDRLVLIDGKVELGLEKVSCPERVSFLDQNGNSEAGFAYPVVMDSTNFRWMAM